MSMPIKGDPEVDKMTLQKVSEAYQYVKDNLKQLDEATLTGMLYLIDEIEIHLNRALDWRLKQGAGGRFVARLHKLIDGLGARIAVIEGKLEVPAPSTKTEEVEVTTLAEESEITTTADESETTTQE